MVASTTNNFLWFALTFWIYLETRSVVATSIVGGTYMLLFAASGIFFGTFVDRQRRKTSMVVSTAATFVFFVLAALVYTTAPEGSIPDLNSPSTWIFVALILAGAIAGNLRAIALSTTVTLLVPDDRHDRANGLVGTANGVAFAITSVFSGLAIGQLGMGACLVITVVLTAVTMIDLLSIRIDNDTPPHGHESPAEVTSKFDARGAWRSVLQVPGLVALLFYSMFNNFLAGVFMALIDPYGLELVSVEAWGVLLAVTSFGFIVGGVIVARRGLGSNPIRTLLLVDLAMWAITILFPIRPLVFPLAIGFFLYMVAIPIAESAEQTIIQRVVPYREQGRVFGFAQTVETAAAPITAFVIGPIAQTWVIPFMTDGTGAETIGPWFGTGPDRGMALIFIVAGLIGLVAVILALNSSSYRTISASYADHRPEQTSEKGLH